MVHSVSGWTRGVQVELQWDPLRTRVMPERLRGAIQNPCLLYHRTAPVFDLCIRNFQKNWTAFVGSQQGKAIVLRYHRCTVANNCYGWITQRRWYTRELAGQLTVAHGAVRLQPGRTRRGENSRLPRWEETRRGSALHDATRVSFIS